ncbi:MAG TPA: hypothetical protein VMN78_06250 [Longimicrobiales bacterium]|nr:hypothetical protein [Longimicrobiales bacterium]
MAAEFPSRVPVPVRHALEVASAVAHDRLLEEHRLCALELLERAKQELPTDRIVEMYLRLHHLDEADAVLLQQRLLLTAGRHRRLNEVFIGADGDEQSGGLLETPRGLLSSVRRRLRGRVHAELRHWVELHTGRTEMRLLRIHAEQALGFVRALDGILTSGSAVELYQRRLKVRSSLCEVLYLMVLERLSAPEVAVVSDAPAAERPLIAAVRSHRTRRDGSARPSAGDGSGGEAAVG